MSFTSARAARARRPSPRARPARRAAPVPGAVRWGPVWAARSDSSCSSCGFGCSCPGCSADDAGTGSCVGTPVYSSCSLCPSAYCGNSTSNDCPSCTLIPATGSCSGSVNTCAYVGTSLGGQAACLRQVGCSWVLNDAGVGTCTGTPAACGTLTTSTTCDNQSACTWTTSGTSTCTGTVPSCGTLTTSSACSGLYGCNWSSGTTSCAGSLTPCNQLTAQSSCGTQPGCSWSTTGSVCMGTITTCNELATQVACHTQPGCLWQ